MLIIDCRCSGTVSRPIPEVGVLIDDVGLAPESWGLQMSEGIDEGVTISPGKVLGLLGELRKRCGTLKAKKKDGVKFKVRSLDELVDKVRGPANDLGLLIYPASVVGKGHVVDDGTLAEVVMVVRIQAIEDGSFVDVMGFGLGADNQDKAGGKAGSYAFKQALIQTFMAGGAEDTDDTDTPIKGGVRPRNAGKPTSDVVRAALEGAQDRGAYDAAIALARQLSPDKQLELVDLIKVTKARVVAPVVAVAVPAAAVA